ncbi:MAG: hypothetical protein Kow0037_18590 [Calditrichia bacterium]
MLNFYDQPIRRKIILIIISMALLAIILGFSILIVNNIRAIKKELIHSNRVTAAVVADYLASDLFFMDKNSARQSLARLRLIDDITGACVYTAEGKVFTVYQGEIAEKFTPPDFENIKTGFFNDALWVLAPIRFQDKLLGYLLIKSRLTKLDNRIKYQFSVLSLVLVIVLFAISIIAFRVQALISNPIIKLSRIAEQVSEKGDFNIRVSKPSNDEIGILYDSFNRMLSQIGMFTKELINKNEEIQENQQRLQILMDTIPDAMFLHEIDGKIIDCNLTAASLFGFAEDNLQNKNIQEFFAGEMAANKIEHRIQDTLANEYYDFQMEAQKADGSAFPVEVRMRRLFSLGRVFILSVITDITRRKQAQMKLRESEFRYRTLFEQSPVGVVSFNKNLELQEYNNLILDLSGISATQLNGLDLKNYQNESWFIPFKESLDGKRGFYQGEVNIPISNRKKWIILRTTPLLDSRNEITGVLGLVEDATERKILEEELLKSRKLESVGILAGGIAHDFNNILTAVLGNISLLISKYGDSPDISQKLKNAEKAALRARDLTQQLLTFSKGGAPIRETKNIRALIEDTVQFSLRGSNVRYQLNLAEDLKPASIDEGQISQVIQNLVINADQAMPEGGTLAISAENQSLPAGNPYGLPAGDYICIRVKDKGVGIAPEHLDKIFDPYFTTKQKGSGLGLATSYSIIKQHEGKILVNSQLGKGTEFSIFLPASTEIIKASEDESPMTESYSEARILIMDDDEMVREVGGAMLQSLGYQVEYAAEGKEALEKYQAALENGSPYDLVIMDLTIPGGMGGKDAIVELMRMDPNARAIVSSGYSHDAVMSDYKSYGFKGLIAKPFRLEELKRVVSETLQQSGKSSETPDK